jgi:DNA-binding protein YbaB
MAMRNEHGKTRLAIEIKPELRQRIESAAAEEGVSLRDYVVAALQEALEQPKATEETAASGAWSRLSVPSFAREWDSDADAIYDDLGAFRGA